MATPSPYQRVGNASVTPSDYDYSVGTLYLRFNGVNQWMQTNPIDFSSTDKMTVFAGVRKLSDAASGVVVELAAAQSVTGAISLVAREYVVGDYGLDLRGTSGYTWQNYIGFAAPITSVLAAQYNQAGTSINQELSLRVNGSLAALGAVAGGPNGNTVMANASMFIGARAGTSLWFNGRIYSLVVRGAQSTAEQITATENYVELKTFGKDMSYVFSDPVLTADFEQITTAGGDSIYMTASYQ